MRISAIPFPYRTGAVTKKQFEEHMTLYKGYVDKVNSITEELTDTALQRDANGIYSVYRGLKKAETFAIDGTILHELYFGNMTNREENPHTGAIAVFNKYYGSYDAFISDFIACAKSARGWVVFSYEQRTQRFRNILLDAHDFGDVTMAYPVLVLDMYEHAYFTDYGTDKAKYINEFIKYIDWKVVDERLKKIM